MVVRIAKHQQAKRIRLGMSVIIHNTHHPILDKVPPTHSITPLFNDILCTDNLLLA
uniref:Uncharacterized protein n=1 Tax=Oryza brachyantha TaxID=4533 RepID=J3N859_ORYBR